MADHSHDRSHPPTAEAGSKRQKVRHFLFGRPKDLRDSAMIHRLSLIPFLAWVGLGADGLSSSSYGPEEAFRALGEHTYLAVLLVALMAFTVLIISAAYRRIIEAFPHGGGGYVVASKLLGRKVGLVSGCALLVDYILTITVSIAAAGDALFSFLPPEWHGLKLTCELIFIITLTILNIRGVRESVTVMAPIFILFLISHGIAITLGIVGHLPEVSTTATHVAEGFRGGMHTLGPWAMFLLFIHAYSLGGGTYTGIEAVSNGLPIMREPRAETAKRTMTYMAISLALTASGLLLCYLLWKVTATDGKTMNAVLLEQLANRYLPGSPLGRGFVIVSLVAEGFLLIVAAQAGFIDGPRVLANMAVDSWVPRRFAALSERLTTANGIILMGALSLAALVYTGGNVSHLVVMYSINVFLTFSLSIFGMLVHHFKKGRTHVGWRRDMTIFAVGFLLCITILVITILEKFSEGGWVTLAVTTGLVVLCFVIKRHYLEVAQSLHRLQIKLDRMEPRKNRNFPGLDPDQRTAAILVGGYGGLGIHCAQTILKTFPGVYNNFVFLSIGVVDSGGFKGEDAVEELADSTEAMLDRYVKLGEGLGIATTYRYSIGTDIVAEGEKLCEDVTKEFKQTTFFTGKIIFEREQWYQRLLHNETGLALQKRLQLSGHTMVVLPAKVS